MFAIYKLKLVEDRERSLDLFNVACNRTNVIDTPLADLPIDDGIKTILDDYLSDSSSGISRNFSFGRTDTAATTPTVTEIIKLTMSGPT